MKKDNLPHNHHQIFENKSEAIPKTTRFPRQWQISLNSWETEAASAFLASLPLRRVCHQSLFSGGHEQPRCIPSSEAAENCRPDCPAGVTEKRFTTKRRKQSRRTCCII